MKKEIFMQLALFPFILIWAIQCDEPGFLSEVALRRNGVEQSPDCTEVYDTLRAHLQPGGRLDQLPDATVNALKIWAIQCDEPGFLSEVVLRRNGVEQSPDCTEEEERPIVSTSNMPSENQLAVKIYPNPTTSTLNVEYPEFIEQGRLRLFNLQGQAVSNIALFEKSSRISIQVSHLAPGVYLVELHHSQGLPFRKKIVISQ